MPQEIENLWFCYCHLPVETLEQPCTHVGTGEFGSQAAAVGSETVQHLHTGVHDYEVMIMRLHFKKQDYEVMKLK
jgi:hypothetical protein